MNTVYELSRFFSNATVEQKTEVLLEICKREPQFLIGVINGVAGEAIDAPWKSTAKDLLRANKKINAIKECRAATGWSLKDAKDAVEKLQQEMGL